MSQLYRLISAFLIASMFSWTTTAVAQSGSLTCSSDDGGYRYCRADTWNQVRLSRQLSGSPCQQGYSWGFDYRGIWVDRGCRAQFQYGDGDSGNSGSNNTGAAVAAGILGAIVVGSIIASQNSNNNDQGYSDPHRDAYRDGYRRGQQDWDNGFDPYYLRYRNRFSRQTENDFSAGYDDGYNNRPNLYR
jgi:hypothetical protein